MTEPTAAAKADEQIRLLRGELRAALREIAELEGRNETLLAERDRATSQFVEACDQLRELRASTSWRFTAPLRAFRRRRSGTR